ncbi:energy-coupling factor transporter transmembrane component T family protein [Lactobacillus sp. PV034]|uniref:energy-coupling factor transporter transmembrane component T family protein n=1 Tax=Lactobacillus sp. PV034 TaxID=2594495 RepID=UPI002240CAB0|nr:energy-coupling factor transporter transmembrane component T [Lactobacillus sp. PV034]QNQ81074.1 energy-coupling factor transporter transmembrane protein EcfT [Lactobacillus sp. PV034]
MNPSLKLILILIISLEISFKPTLWANLILIVGALIFLLLHHLSLKEFLLILFFPLLGAIAIFSALYFFAPDHNLFYAWTLFTRLYVFVFLGACLTLTTSPSQLSRSLEQNLHLPSKFAYGTLAAFNVIPKMKEEVTKIHYAAQMRGTNLSFWSPRLYFKAILVALAWAQGLSQGMLAHGYRENQSRSNLQPILITKKDWLFFLGILILVQPIIFFF